MTDNEKVRQSLHTLLTQAEIDFEMWKAMRNARADPEVTVMLNRRYARFYIAAENGLFNSLVTILYKLFETRPDTVNFRQLIKMLPEDMDSGIKEEIDALMRVTKETWLKVVQVRNKVVGHQSMIESVEDVYREAGISICELEEMVKNAQKLLVLVAGKFHDTHVVFNLKGTAAFDNLLGDLRASPAWRPGRNS
ncbi:hypothetical protein [Lysobacter enzymogenes]|uniref:AbiU2 domain-containing protein n=1 Tax=Lysobacter enzymogenes TaxID=69 RepID=UPI001AF2DB1E|nr:hypothetical protein [Lysobacter enzymogenes]QQQ02518.1 hypothetical protein JHW41_05925 [Lysobacter enzymogenes]